MSAVDWNDLLESPRHFERLEGEAKERASEASSFYIAQLAMGISAVGNLLACTATNGVTGLGDDTAAKVGWMMIAVGDLITRLNDIAEATMPEAGQGGGNGPNAG